MTARVTVQQVHPGSLPPWNELVAGADLAWTRDGEGFACIGEAMRIEDLSLAGDAPVAVLAALRSFPVDGDVRARGTGPVALGALPFSPSSVGSVVIPAFTVRRLRDGRTFTTQIGDATDAWPRREVRSRPGPDRFVLESPLSHVAFLDLVERATKEIEAGELSKVVLARAVHVEADVDLHVPDIVRRLLTLHPSCTIFAVDGFVGASPELLIGRAGADVWTHPLAGTVGRSGDADADAAMALALMDSAKDREEHRYVIEAIASALGPFCSTLDVPERPAILNLRNVTHLATPIRGTLHGEPSALELAAALHPTPAVGGTPSEGALAFIEEHEGLDRGRYAGPVGWLDASGDGEWAVGIRCADIEANRARLVAGVGIVRGSEAEAELAETQLKLQALLAAIVRP